MNINLVRQDLSDLPMIKTSKLALFSILLLSAFLNLYQLSNEGYGNTYYAAGVKSMLNSWRNFFFVSFDPSGFVSIDKPPLGFWIQTASTMLFGFSGWSLILPQAFAGIISVFVIYRIVSTTSGQSAGLLAALFMAVTPIAIATNRNNTIDSLLVLTSLLSVWAILRAIETRSLFWWLACMGLVGVGFNIKMAQAFLILPGCLLIYYFVTPLSVRKKIFHLFLGGAILVIISIAWMAIIDLTPPNQRPYVGGSHNNSTFELAVNYNGITRWIGLPQPESYTSPNFYPNQPNDGILPDEIGKPGILRLFSRPLAGQISWLLPISLFALVFLFLSNWKSKTQMVHYRFEILWGAWLIIGIVFFCSAAFFHRHYLIMLAPPISALSAMGFSYLIKNMRRNKWVGFLTPIGLITGVATSLIILLPYLTWSRWLSPMVIGMGVVSIVGLTGNNLINCSHYNNFEHFFVGLGIVSLIIPQLVWAGIPVFKGGNGGLPFAGPDVLTWNRTPTDVDIQSLLDDLNRNYEGERYFVGTLDYDPAEWIILKTGRPVMVMGGFYGNDPILTPSTLAAHVVDGEIRYFFFYEKTVHELRPDLLTWFHQNCTANYAVPSGGEEYFQLYDCKSKSGRSS